MNSPCPSRGLGTAAGKGSDRVSADKIQLLEEEIGDPLSQIILPRDASSANPASVAFMPVRRIGSTDASTSH